MKAVNDVCYKRHAVIEFLIAEKESVGNIYKHLCNAYGSAMVDRSTISHSEKSDSFQKFGTVDDE
jgi:hypothetical protein